MAPSTEANQGPTRDAAQPRTDADMFRGPLFIVGMPRSGTTLTRSLLNRNPRINLVEHETHFIPKLVRRFGNPPELESASDLAKITSALRKAPFFGAMSRRGYCLEPETLFRGATPDSWSSILERMLRNLTAHPDDPDLIWGDKTPGYLRHIPLLSDLFPNCRILHVIRDPRDSCTSVRQSWGKSIYRAAQRWRDTLAEARPHGSALGPRYLEMRYEALLADPEKVLRQVCDWAECAYDPRMLRLDSSGETDGRAAGVSGLLHGNSGNYRAALRPSEIARIEEIVYDVAVDLGYPLEHAIAMRPIGALPRAGYYLFDGAQSLRLHIRRAGGVAGGAQRFFNHYRLSSWR